MTYEVQQTRWDRIIRRVSGSIGPGSRVSETISELFPMIDVERIPGELLLLGGTRLGFATFVVQATAGAFGAAQLQNPAGSNAIITVTQAIMSGDQTGILSWGIDEPALATALPNAGRLRDTREVFPTQPVGLLRIQTNLVAPVGGQGQTNVFTDRNFTLKDSNGIVILAPGEAFVVGYNQVARELLVSFFWRERPAEESELSL